MGNLSVDKSGKISLRGTYGDTLVELGKENPNIVVLDADVSCSTQTQKFAKVFPERFFNIGIAEQDAIGTAAGLSTCGKIPFVSMFAIFASGRAWDQVRNTIAYSNFNVKIVATHGGITVGEDGATHQALEDVALMRSIPGMTVIVPSDAVETQAAIKFATQHVGPMYIRLPRTALENIFDEEKYSFDLNKATIINEGIDVTIVSNGETLCEVVKCAKTLAEKGIIAEVISLPVVKPFDETTVIKSAQKTGAVAVVENHSIVGGIGSAVCECISENNPVLVKRIGTKDQFGQSGKDSLLMKQYGLTAETFIDQIVELVQRKSRV